MDKPRFYTFVLTVALAAALQAQSDQKEAETYIRKSESEWAESVASGDAKGIERILAEDFIGIDPKGKSYDKPSMIADTKEGPKYFVSNHLDEVKVRFYGDTAVAQGSESWVRQTGEKGRFVWTDTWLRRNGRWQIVAAEDLVAPPSQTPEENAIKARRTKQNEAIVANKIDEIVSFWTDDVTICRGLGIQLAGKAAYRKLFEEDTNSPNKVVYQREPRSVEASAHWPLAFETGTWIGHQGDAKGPAVISGRYSTQWVKRDGQWLIRAEVFVATGGTGPGLEMKAAP
jgi:ketosteroid isomerase-like protein